MKFIWYSRLPVTRTLYNLNLPLTRSNFLFPSDRCLYNYTLHNSTRCTYLPSLIDSSRSAWWRPSSPAWWLLLSISVSNPKHQYANLSRRKVWLCSLLVKGNCWPPMEIWYHDQSSFHYVGICGHQYTSAFSKFLLTSWSFPSKSNTMYWVCAYSYKAFFLYQKILREEIWK